MCGEDAYCPGGKLGKKIEVSTKAESEGERPTPPAGVCPLPHHHLTPFLPPLAAHRPSTPPPKCPAGYSTAGVTTAASIDACFIVCDPGSYAAITTGPEATCYACGPGFFCQGGPQGKGERLGGGVGGCGGGWRGAG